MNVFEKLAKELNVTAEEIEEKWVETNKKSVDEAAEKLKKFYKNNSGSNTLNENMKVDPPIYIKGVLYQRTIDWDDTVAVNIIKGKSYGRDANKPRKAKKRNYSLRPATTHDLAYIISVGREGVVGNNFIKRGWRSIRKWEHKRDLAFETELNKLGKKFE